MSESEWIPWSGGECPEPAPVVQYRRRDGMEGEQEACTLMGWDHFNRGSDIVAYRLALPATPERQPTPGGGECALCGGTGSVYIGANEPGGPHFPAEPCPDCGGTGRASPAHAASGGVTDAKIKLALRWLRGTANGVETRDLMEAAGAIEVALATSKARTYSEPLTEPVLCFLYALLGSSTAHEAGAIWERNPDDRKRAHEAVRTALEATGKE